MNRPESMKLQSLVLLVGQLIFLFSSIFWDNLEPGSAWPHLLFILVFAAGGYAMAEQRRWLVTYLLTTACGVGFGATKDSDLLASLSLVGFLVCFALLFTVLIKHCFFRPTVPAADRLLGGIAGYFLLGFFWLSQFRWALLDSAEALVSTVSGEAATASERIYFVFVTLTSLGYGDVLPMTPLARILAVLCCVSGVLYLAVFISALLGGMTTGSRGKDSPADSQA